MKLLEKILFATDFSQAADSALQMAMFAAKAFDSEILLIHVMPELHDSAVTLDQVKKASAKRLENIQAHIRNQGIQVAEPIVAVGTPFDQIIQCGDRRDVNVIMIGSGQKAREEKFRLGMTAERLIRRASKPVWVVKSDAPPMVKKILCPVDFSDPSRRALDNALHLSRNFQAEVAVLTVIEPLSSIYRATAHRAAKAEEQTWFQQQESAFESFVRDFDFDSVSWTKALRHGRPHQEILTAVREGKFDLLIMGSEGRTGLARILLGSVAEKVVREIPCSIITVKSEHAIRLRQETEIADIEARFKRGQELLQKGFLREALHEFELVTAQAMLYAPAWEGLAAAHKRLGHEGESKRYTEMAKHIRRTLWQQRVEAEIRAHHPLRGKKR